VGGGEGGEVGSMGAGDSGGGIFGGGGGERGGWGGGRGVSGWDWGGGGVRGGGGGGGRWRPANGVPSRSIRSAPDVRGNHTPALVDCRQASLAAIDASQIAGRVDPHHARKPKIHNRRERHDKNKCDTCCAQCGGLDCVTVVVRALFKE